MRINRRENEGGDHPQLSNTVQFSDGNTKKFPNDQRNHFELADSFPLPSAVAFDALQISNNDLSRGP
jgi:hypothetical protein